MNAIIPIRYDENQRVELIGKETLSLSSNLSKPAGGGCANIVILPNTNLCSPRMELHRLLNSPVSYSASELEDAERAVARMSNYDQLSDAEWAENLGADLAKFTD